MNGTNFIESIGHLFYVVSPNRTSFKRFQDVPDYNTNAVPYLTGMFLLEVCVSMYTKRSSIRLNDTISCLMNGIFMEAMVFLAPGGGLYTYFYIYVHYRLVDLPWDSPLTWWCGFLAFDFMYYWSHRLVHEVNLLWATHIVHHSSEDYNISTNVRQSVLQYLYLWVILLPQALFVPLTVYYVHSQFNRLYQFWIHTETIGTLGPLEYILVTPSHHRVHHGRNRNCIDKNFGGTLIIWDRLFGTFEAEKETVLYGLTHPINSFDLIKIQFDHLAHMWKCICSYKGVYNKLSVLFKGPGWSPGKPWHGEIEDIPDVKAPVPKYDVQLPLWCNIYALVHFLALVQGHLTFLESFESLSSTALYGIIFQEILSIYAISILLDKKSYFPKVEVVRCLSYFMLNCYLSQYSKLSMSNLQARWCPEALILIFQLASLLLWFTYISLEAIMRSGQPPTFVLRDPFKKIFHAYNDKLES